MQKSTIGIYVHVPFCPHICPYCDFVKTARFRKKDIEIFFRMVLEQYRQMRDEYLKFASTICNTHRPTATLYFGGGTPGLFSGATFAPLISEVSQDFLLEETTIETNPYSFTSTDPHTSSKTDLFSSYAAIGVDRVTLGAQSLCESALKFLGRKHTPSQILQSIKRARSAGITQVQVDLIYGLPSGVRKISVEEEVEQLIAAGATGISAYALTIETRTEFGKRTFAAGDMEDTAIAEYAAVLETCKKACLRQVESSNFSRFEAKHNNIYWYGAPYLGLGTGAHGLLPPQNLQPFGRRYRVGKVPKELSPGNDLLSYSDVNAARELFTLELEPVRSLQDLQVELLFTLLRTPMGLTNEWLKFRFTTHKLAKLYSDPIVSRGIAEGRILSDALGLRLAETEKIRGDSWTEKISRILCD